MIEATLSLLTARQRDLIARSSNSIIPTMLHRKHNPENFNRPSTLVNTSTKAMSNHKILACVSQHLDRSTLLALQRTSDPAWTAATHLLYRTLTPIGLLQTLLLLGMDLIDPDQNQDYRLSRRTARILIALQSVITLTIPCRIVPGHFVTQPTDENEGRVISLPTWTTMFNLSKDIRHRAVVLDSRISPGLLLPNVQTMIIPKQNHSGTLYTRVFRFEDICDPVTVHAHASKIVYFADRAPFTLHGKDCTFDSREAAVDRHILVVRWISRPYLPFGMATICLAGWDVALHVDDASIGQRLAGEATSDLSRIYHNRGVGVPRMDISISVRGKQLS